MIVYSCNINATFAPLDISCQTSYCSLQSLQLSKTVDNILYQKYELPSTMKAI